MGIILKMVPDPNPNPKSSGSGQTPGKLERVKFEKEDDEESRPLV